MAIEEVGGPAAAGPQSRLRFRLDLGSGVPVYLQLVHQVEQAARLGYLKAGDQLPTVKEAVTDLAINPNTVQKAYRELDRRGITAGRPGLGTFVKVVPSGAAAASVASLRQSLLAWLAEAADAGLDDDATSAIFASAQREARDIRGLTVA